MRKILREVLSWVFAILLAAGILNLFAFCFYHPVHNFSRVGGATPCLTAPHQWGLYGTEGYGIQTIDSEGYTNPDLPREPGYFCVIGSSHAEGYNVPRLARFSDLLNQKFGFTHSLKFYNISASGFYFADIAQRFPALTEEFSDAQGVIIEIASTACSPEDLKAALDGIGFSPERDSMQAIQARLTRRDRAIIRFKDWAPFLRELTRQLEVYRIFRHPRVNHLNAVHAEDEFDLAGYAEALEPVLHSLRTHFNGPILIVYHPAASLLPDGSLAIDDSVTDPVFAELCARNDIRFLNMGDAFRRAYETDYTVPYGFWNTTLSAGHLNQAGHRLVADALYSYLLEMGIV